MIHFASFLIYLRIFFHCRLLFFYSMVTCSLILILRVVGLSHTQHLIRLVLYVFYSLIFHHFPRLEAVRVEVRGASKEFAKTLMAKALQVYMSVHTLCLCTKTTMLVCLYLYRIDYELNDFSH